MTNHWGRGVGVSIVGLGLLALVISAPAGDPGDREADRLRASTGDRLPSAWGEPARKAAETMLEKYGEPDEATQNQLVWNAAGPFLKTVVYKEGIPHDFPRPHSDVIEQYVEYAVPFERYGDLARFDGSLRADATTGLLSARGESERDNFVALNLADEIARGRRTAASARRASVELAALAAAGKTSPYFTGLLFKAQPRKTASR